MNLVVGIRDLEKKKEKSGSKLSLMSFRKGKEKKATTLKWNLNE